MSIHQVLSGQQILDQVRLNPSYYNNTQNVEMPRINAVLSSDQQLLAQIGYKQELNRDNFKLLQVFGIAFSIMGILPSIASIMGTGLIAGPSGLLYLWIVASFFVLTIGISMAENGSSQPTSGGLYYWSNFYAPPRWKTVISYVVGNTNSIALIGALCSVDYGFAQELLSIVVIGKDGDFTVTPAKTYGIFAACVVAHIFITCASSKHSAWLQTTSVVVNVGIVVLFVIALPIGAKGNFRSARFVFANFQNYLTFPIGWTQLSQAWLPAIWTIGAFDSVIHMSEECHHAASTIPVGIIGSITACWGIGTVVIIVTLFCMLTDDVQGQYLGSKFGQPMAQVIYDAMGKKWAIAFMVLICIAQFLMGASILTAISRQIWAFSRDNGLPFLRWIKKVNKKLSVPINAVWFGGIASIIVGLLCVIGTTASQALFTLYIAGNYFSWGMPTFLRLTLGKAKFVPGPFYLGPFWSLVCGWTSSIFCLYTIVMVMFPVNKSPDKTSMNYTCVITPGVWILSLAYYYIYAHKIYHGPQKTIDIEDEGNLSVYDGEMVNGTDRSSNSLVRVTEEKLEKS